MKKCILFSICFISVNQLLAQPVINSFSPVSGPVGTTVIITGNGFSTVPSANIVYFGAVQAPVSAASNNSLTVTVPSGATFQPVTVTTNNFTTYSANSFAVTFNGGGSPFTAASFVPATGLTTGIYPHGVLLGDFNGDGKPDLLVSKGSSASIAAFTNISSPGSISFGNELDFPAYGFSHESAAAGDLDGDGKLDVAIANSFNTTSISVYKNNGVGATISFASKIDYAADSGVYNLAIGDIDGDGKPDIVAANGGSSVISFYKNVSTPGTISFQARVDFNTGSNPYGIAVGDLDGDGKPDIVITTQGSSSQLSVMKNTTSGGVASFDPPVDYAYQPGYFTVSIGDLDGDGKPDIAAANFSNSVVVLKNMSSPGNLSFSSYQTFNTDDYPDCVSLGDIDGDGKPDMITSNKQSNNISTLRNTSTVGNISFENHVEYAAGANPIYVTVGDLDGDGRPDVVNANSSADALSIFRNITGANVAPIINSFSPTSGINGTSVTILGANFTGATSVKFGGVEAKSFTVDSAKGIIAIAGTGATGDISVTTANGTATLAGFVYNGPIINSFSPAVGVPGTTVTITGTNFMGASSVTFGGVAASSFIVNSATNITAIIGAGASGSVKVTTSNGTAILDGFSFGVPAITSFTPVSGPVGTTVNISGANFNPTASSNVVFFGAVKATVSAATTTELQVIVPAGATYQPITVTTQNLTAYSSRPFMITFPADSVLLSANSFSPAGNFGVGTYPFAVKISDLNDDGKPDLITANAVKNSISVLKNTSAQGVPSFSQEVQYNTGPDPLRIAVGDLDGDGKPDVVVMNFNSGNASTISIFRNTSSGGDIAFAPKADYSTGNGSIGLDIADMDGDGKPDLIVSSGNSGFFSFFKNVTVSAGAISFAPKQDYTLLTHPDNIAVADLDNDGKPDLITSNFSNNSISIFGNTSVGGSFSLGPRMDYTAGSNPSFVTTTDLDGDGKADIVLSNYSSGTISFFKNISSAGSISFLQKEDYTLGTSNISIADLNGDGLPDLVTGRGLTGIASILQNTYGGAGSFSFAPNIDFTTGTYDTYVAAGDLDGDGKPELVIANTIENNVSILKNKIGSPVIKSASTVAVGMGTSISINGSNFAGATSVTFGGTPASSFAVNSSTKIEAVVGNGSSGNIEVTNASGTATFAGFKFIPHIIKGGPVTFCQNESVILTSTAGNNNQWFKDGAPISNAAGNTLQVNASGSYSVQTINEGITTSADSDVIVTVKNVATPTILKDATNTLVSSATAGNQWYLNNAIIPGATGQTFKPSQTGNYTVQNTFGGCLSDFSTTFNFALSGLVNLGNGQFINLYPNPVKGQVNLNWNIDGMPLLNIQVTDLKGNQLLTKTNVHSGTTIDLSNLPSGMLLLKIFSNNPKVNNTIKIIKE